MALYRDAVYLTQVQSDVFDKEFTPGQAASHSGIYRCKNCGSEIAANIGNPLPPENHSQHTAPGPIRWKLIVWA